MTTNDTKAVIRELADNTLEVADYLWATKAAVDSIPVPDYGDALVAASRIVVAIWERQNQELDDHCADYFRRTRGG